MVRRGLPWAVVVICGWWCLGCPPPQHCQSGAKHGTHCYDQVGDDPPYETGSDEDEATQLQSGPPPTTQR